MKMLGQKSGAAETTQRAGRGTRVSLIVGAIAAGTALYLTASHIVEPLELKTYDMRFALRRELGFSRRPTNKVIVAAIGSATNAAWSEPMIFWGQHYANVIRGARKAGAAVIGLDIVQGTDADAFLSRFDAGGPNAFRPDAAFIEALEAEQNHVVLGVVPTARDETGRTPQEQRPALPPDSILYASGVVDNLGFAEMPRSADGIVREGYAYLPVADPGDSRVMPSFAALLTARATGRSPQDKERLRGVASDGTYYINYTDPPLRTIEATKLENPATLTADEKEWLKDAIVILGATFPSAGDRATIPSGVRDARAAFHQGYENVFPGAAIQAQATATLLENAALRRLPEKTEEWIVGLLAALSLILAIFYARRPESQDTATLQSYVDRPGMIATGALFRALLPWGISVLIYLAIAALMFLRSGWLLPVAGPLLALTLPYIAFYAANSIEESLARLRAQLRMALFNSPLMEEYARNDKDGTALRGKIEPNVTVLFMDLRGSTQLARQFENPIDFFEMINRMLKATVPTLENHEGSLLRYTGDGFLAIFGVPHKDSRNPAADAVNYALSALDSVKALNGELKKEWGRMREKRPSLPEWEKFGGFRVGFGIHSGEIVFGNIGTDRRMELTPIGDTPNTAAKLEGLNKRDARLKDYESQIAVSAETMRQMIESPAALLSKENFRLADPELSAKIEQAEVYFYCDATETNRLSQPRAGDYNDAAFL